LTGSGGIKIEIKLVPQQPSAGPVAYNEIIPMDHYPSWKLHKNPFWRVKHPSSLASMNKMAAVAPNAITGELEVKSQLFAYEAQQDVGGVVTLHIAPGKKIEHLGIKVQFIGRIDMVSATILVWTPSFTTWTKCFVRIWASITLCS
jgi:Vacuolar protein sorting-associated protein 26